jgi:hypothetical protein
MPLPQLHAPPPQFEPPLDQVAAMLPYPLARVQLVQVGPAMLLSGGLVIRAKGMPTLPETVSPPVTECPV